LIVTPVLPVWAMTAATPLPVHVTVVLLGGALLLHAAIAEGVSALDNSTTLPKPIPNVFFIVIVLCEGVQRMGGTA